MGIIIRSLNKTIKNQKVLSDISLNFDYGHVYGLQGKNGSGKTMLMRIVCGLVHPTSGEVEIDGEIIGKDIKFPRSIGALIESPTFLPNCSAMENLEMLALIQNNISKEELIDVLNIVGLSPTDKKKYRKFSLGMKQRLGIASAIIGNPRIILLDEPFNALDVAGVEKIRNLIKQLKENGTLIVLACHNHEELYDLSDEILVLDNGKILKG